MEAKLTRHLGRSGIPVSALGLGCWAIGGPFASTEGMPLGWSQVDDNESVRAIHKALDMGITFFDTADIYGAGHSEEILNKALAGRSEDVVIATKFGMVFNTSTKQFIGQDASPEYIRKAVEASLNRLKREYIDLYQLHLKDYSIEDVGPTREMLETLVQEGKIRGYAWSTDDYEKVKFFAEGPNCIAVQHELNIFVGNPMILELCEEKNLASINRGPLAMGLLTGKYHDNSTFPADDVRTIMHLFDDEYYSFFKDGKPVLELLKKIEAIREVLMSDGRTLAQGALSWIWARSEKTIPIPGFKTVKQVEENAGAMQFGPLTSEQMLEIDKLIGK